MALLLEALLVCAGVWAVSAWGLRRMTGDAARGRQGQAILLASTGLLSGVVALLYLPVRHFLG